MLVIYNSLTKTKEAFKPLQPRKLGLYVCGVTVYDYCHIGHGRTYMVFDMVIRYFKACGYAVNYVRNITDIDDNIIKRSQENHEEYAVLTERFINAMHEDFNALQLLSPHHEPRATEYIAEMIAMIEQLIAKNYAYVATNGDVYYDIHKFSSYGQLAHQNLEQLQSGIRVDVLDAKRNPLDFVLWKLAKPGEPKWASPWGEGRPGWHIECSAMAGKLLGQPFDIHGGGIDLIFPHHQNEVAQSESAGDCRFVNTWMHGGHVQINEEKMSKSLNNFSTIRDVLAKYNTETARYFLLASHYRSPINYTEENLNSAHQALIRFYTCLKDLPDSNESKSNTLFEKKFYAAMDDDFNTPIALSVLFDLVRKINKLKIENKITEAADHGIVLKKLGNILGLLQQDPRQFLQSNLNDSEVEKIENLINLRNHARATKNWIEADNIRKQLTALGVVIEDNSNGTSWKYLK